MPVPDFSPGEVLTAAAMDSIGLWLVKTQTIGTTQSNVLVPNAFNSNFENYKIVLIGGVGSVGQAINLQLDGSAVGYYGTTLTSPYAGGAPNNNNINAASSWTFAGTSNTVQNFMSVEIFNPQKAKVTMVNGTYVNPASGSISGFFSGFHDSATAFTGFRLIVGGNMTGGTIRVYGYRD